MNMLTKVMYLPARNFNQRIIDDLQEKGWYLRGVPQVAQERNDYAHGWDVYLLLTFEKPDDESQAYEDFEEEFNYDGECPF